VFEVNSSLAVYSEHTSPSRNYNKVTDINYLDVTPYVNISEGILRTIGTYSFDSDVLLYVTFDLGKHPSLYPTSS
jgi:hypothetical protein